MELATAQIACTNFLISLVAMIRRHSPKFTVHTFCFQIRRANEDTDTYDESKFSSSNIVELLTNSKPPEHEIPEEVQNSSSFESTGPSEAETKSNYKRTLSGGLQSPVAEVPKSKLLERINSKKGTKSYQLGHRLSRKWSTGAGPRIGCVNDYPEELRQQALEFVNLSPRTPPTPSSFKRIPGLPSPTSLPTADSNINGDAPSAAD